MHCMPDECCTIPASQQLCVPHKHDAHEWPRCLSNTLALTPVNSAPLVSSHLIQLRVQLTGSGPWQKATRSNRGRGTPALAEPYPGLPYRMVPCPMRNEDLSLLQRSIGPWLLAICVLRHREAILLQITSTSLLGLLIFTRPQGWVSQCWGILRPLCAVY